MKAAPMGHRPEFTLMKLGDIQSYYHLQMPRWLFAGSGIASALSLEAKVAYTFLLNRFQLSRLNGWVNDAGEVFIVYTRESLADEIGISYRKAIDCMKQLAAARLVWEKRCGRGNANQIYLAKVELTDKEVLSHESAPFVTGGHEAATDTRHAEMAYHKETCPDAADAGMNGISPMRHAKTACQGDGLPNPHVKACENGTSRSAKPAGQDMRNPRASKKDNIKKDLKNKDISQSVSLLKGMPQSGGQGACGNAAEPGDDERELDLILRQCGLGLFPAETANVFENAIERLFFSESVRVGNCALPKARARRRLKCLDYTMLLAVEAKLRQNTSHDIINSTAYTMAAIFNAIAESDSNLMVDPYLNRLRGLPPAPDSPSPDGG